MTTKASIASQALTLLRANTIESLNQDSEEAEVVNVFYTSFIEDIFSRYPWSFAKIKEELTASSTPTNEWEYAHTLPAGCLRVIAIYDSASTGARPIKNWTRSGNEIHSNSATLYIQYIYYVPEASWPGYFAQYAYHALAALIAIPITDDENVAAYWKRITYGTDEENERGGKFGVAASVDSQSKPPEQLDMPDLIMARFS